MATLRYIYQKNAVNVLFLSALIGAGLPVAFAGDEVGDIKEGINWTIKTKLTYDSNVFRSPGDTRYIDYGDRCDETANDPNCITLDPVNNPTEGITEVFPTVFDGTFLQLNIKPSFRKKISNNNALEARLKFDSRTYSDATLSNADKSKYSVEFGDEVIFRKIKNKTNKLYLGFFAGHVNARYLDRDTGDKKRFLGEDISKRYTYDYTGFAIKIKLRTTKYKVDFHVKRKDSIYENIQNATNTLSEMVYDNKYTLLAAKVKIPFKRKIKLSLAYDRVTYLYNHSKDYRKSRNGDGTLVKALSPREYRYHKIKLNLRKRHSKKWLSYLDYEYTLRLDRESKEKSEYDNYEKNKIKLRAIHAVAADLKFKYSISVWRRDYENAYAFDNISQERKKYDGQELRIQVNLQSSKTHAYSVDFRYRNDNSTDLRYDYNRLNFSIGIEWKS